MSQYPVLYAGQRLTAPLMSSMLTLNAYKTGATSRAATTANIDDPDLTIAVSAGGVYLIGGTIFTSNANQTGDLKCTIAGPSGASGRWVMLLPSTTSAADPDSVRVASAAIGGTLAYGHPTAGVIGGELQGLVTIGSTAGNVAFNWAQQTSNATGTVVEANSFLSLTRIA